MRKLGAVFWIGLVLASGFTTFKVKHAVQDIDDELNRTRKQIVAEQQEIRVLAAEWTYLNQPERLAELNRVFLQLGPMTARQMQQRIEDLPLRPPATQPDVLLAAIPPLSPPPAPVQTVSAPRPSPAAASAHAAIAAPVASVPPIAAAMPVPAPVGAAPPVPPAIVPAVAVPAPPVIARAVAVPAPQVRLVKAAPASLDALIAQIAHAR
jgi:hypothetical protein